MKHLAIAVAAVCVMAPATAETQELKMKTDLRAVAPALENYTKRMPLGDVWNRPGLSARDRSIVTLAALVARNQTVELSYYLSRALDSGLKPEKISEIITELAFYSGWANAMSAVGVTRDVFATREIGTDRLPTASPKPLPLDETAEAQRAKRVGEQFGGGARRRAVHHRCPGPRPVAAP